MELRYCPDDKYEATIRAFKADKSALATAIEGKMLWVITLPTGEQYALRPESSRPKTDDEQ